MIRENVEKVRQRIFNACAKAGIDPSKITLLCVTKGRSIREIQEAVNSGVNQLGENRIQEALEKYKLIPQARWQMVGHLQSNKAKDAVKIFDLIHSVDTVALAGEINRQAAKINKVQDILLEVKTSPEDSKFGFKETGLFDACVEIAKLKQVAVKGLMTIAPALDSPEQARPYFSRLRQLRDKINPNWLLSMGMSDDFEIAIEEGADIVRLGRIIFENNV
ncbi:MAG: YggS family pyridoxal phosphate-dependent enzyme [Candidatus Omnitrophica bacterium]|nr:YggS family pyridoxal phosphate-dependent enzyme [Candidatus Omnitrophota bacterium]